MPHPNTTLILSISMQKQTLGILLSTPPTHMNSTIAIGLLRIARERRINRFPVPH